MNIFMPCQPYFIRHIKNNDDLLFYAKEFFSTCSAHDIERDEAVLRYKATASTILPKDRPEMFMYHDQILPDEEFVLRLKSDPDLPKAVLCSKYCKDTLELGAELCKTCPFYSGYSSGNIDKEYQILRFASASFDNLLYLKNVISDAKTVFKSRIDLFAGLSEHEPFPVPLPLHLYKILESIGGDCYSVEDEKERLVSLKNKVLSSLVKSGRNGKYDRILEVPPSRQDKIWEIFCLDVLGSDTPSDIATVILELTGEKKASDTSIDDEQLPSIENLFAEQVVDYGVPSSSTDIGESSYGSAAREEVTEPEEPVDNEPLNLSDEDLPFGRADVVTDTEEEQEDFSDEDGAEEDEGTPDEDSTAVGSENTLPPAESIAVPQQKKQEPAVLSAPVPESDVKVTLDDPLWIPSLSSIEFSDPSNMDYDLALCHTVPTEIFHDKNGNLLFVFYIRQKYYVCKPDSLRVKHIMGSSKLTKICWQPFDIYSLCVRNGVVAKSIYSILEKEVSCFPDALSASYTTVCSKYARNFPVLTGDSLYIKGLQMYSRIYALQDMEVKKHPNCIKGVDKYFQLLGYSYHRERNCVEHSRLFKMHTSGQVEFTEVGTLEFMTEGYTLTFIVDNLTGVSINKFYMDALLRFGTEKFSDLQILSITKNQLELFVPAGIYEYVSSYLQIEFDKYALMAGNTAMSVYVASKYHQPKKYAKDRDRTLAEPRYLNEVLDYLASLHAPNEHIGIKQMSLAMIKEVV